ncbi:unnamed protein product, partial [Coregonus sp. 'balchen']
MLLTKEVAPQNGSYKCVIDDDETRSHQLTAKTDVTLASINLFEGNLYDDEGSMPLHWAVQRNQSESCRALLELGAEPNVLNKALMSPLHLAVSQTHNHLVELKHGARLSSQNKLGQYAIHAATFAGSKKAMDVILKAVIGGNKDIIEFCIHKGAKIDQQQVDRSTALHFACSQGATEAVKLMLSSYSRQDRIINLPDGASQTPLHSCGAWRTVALLLSKGANVNIKDKSGCNFLHLAILQPKGLKNLAGDILQHSSVKDLLSTEDNEGCTPLHYACKLGIHHSVNNILVPQVSLERKSKDKKSALHFAAQYGRVNTCQRLLETIPDSRLLNEGDERGLTPLHLASGGGHTKVVDLLLRWTCLHHAAAEGYTRTVKIVLATNIKLLDKLDEDGSTALHVAAREGHVAAVSLLLRRGAEISLNKNHASFFHEALQHGRKDVVNSIIDSDRCTHILRTFKHEAGQRCPVLDLVDLLPESCKRLLDRCIRESDDDIKSPDYHIEYNFQWLQAPIALKKHAKINKSLKIQPLATLNAMVKYNCIELLSHPVCKKYLQMNAAHLLNLFVYLLGLLPLTHLIVSLRPSLDYTGPDNTTAVTMVPISFREVPHADTHCMAVRFQVLWAPLCMVMVLVMNIYSMGKEVMQMYHQRLSYFKDPFNCQDWVVAIFSLLFVIPLYFNAEGFEHFGIYVVMFNEIAKTLWKILLLFLFLMLAFALVFHALMLN